MRIVSDTHTQHVNRAAKGKPPEIAEIPPGTPFDCDDEAAKNKIAAGFARPATTDDVAAAADPGDLVEAIRALDPDDRELWDANDRPRAKVLAEALGRRVSAAERNAAWEQVQAEDQ